MKGDQNVENSIRPLKAPDIPTEGVMIESILKKYDEEDQDFQKDMTSNYVLRLLEQIISDVIYEAEAVAPKVSIYFPEGDSDDDSGDHYARSRLAQINEDFARIPTPPDKSRRVNFDQHKAHISTHQELGSDQAASFSGDGILKNEEGNKVSPRTTIVSQSGDSVDKGPSRISEDRAINKQSSEDSNSKKGLFEVFNGGLREVVTCNKTKKSISHDDVKKAKCPIPARRYNTLSSYDKAEVYGAQVRKSTSRNGPHKADELGHESKRIPTESAKRRRTTFESIEAWIQQKNKIEREKRQSEKAQRMDDKEQLREKEAMNKRYREEKVAAWFKSKSLQRRQEQFSRRLQEAERLLFCAPRSREQCEKAYKEWLRQKAQEKHRRNKEMERRLRIVRNLIRQFKTNTALRKVINQARIYRLI